ncbi:RNA polymerase subunit sigma-70 [Clostridium sp. YIM B02500]|uniref:RNA polymerase subunit sigma-70 n=1 Tax=Clostridium sp. YIM B02500 TaxID=2910681 RepID=UPI001EEE4132|nr:RNA polymerase subunit sigma-70 [Clostridium sp. YIM B02500]
MAEIKSIFNIYRERKCKINNLEIEIENLRLSGSEEKDIRIKDLITEINRLKNENKRIDNILNLLPEKEYKVVKLVLIDCKDKKKVASEIDRTERQLNRILNRAIQKINL